MNYEDRLRQQMEAVVWQNPWVRQLARISKDPTIGVERKIDVRVMVRLEENLGVYDWVGYVKVITDEVVFQDRVIFDYENWPTDANDLGQYVFQNILLRGLFCKEIKPHGGQNV